VQQLPLPPLAAALAAVSACGVFRCPASVSGGRVEEEGQQQHTSSVLAATHAAAVLLTAARQIRTLLSSSTTSSSSFSMHACCGGEGGALAGMLQQQQQQPGATCAAGRPRPSRRLVVGLVVQFAEAVVGACRAVLQHAILQQEQEEQLLQRQRQQYRQQQGCHVGTWRSGGSVSSAMGAGGGEASTAVLVDLTEALIAGLQAEESVGPAARALRALLSSAASLALPLPAPLAVRLAEALHGLPYGDDDAGPRYQAAERDVAQAAVAAVRLAGAAAAGTDGAGGVVLNRKDLLQRLLAPALYGIAHIASSAAASLPPPGLPPKSFPLSRHQDSALARYLRLLDTTMSPAPPPPVSAPHGSCNTPAAAAAAYEAAAAGGDVTAATASDASWCCSLFLQHAWSPLESLLRCGAAGRFLQPLSRALTSLLRTATATASSSPASTSGGMGAQLVLSDAWVASVLEALAGCVGRPGAKQVHEPLGVLLAASCGGAGGEDGRGGSGSRQDDQHQQPGMVDTRTQQHQQQQRKEEHRARLRRYGELAMRVVHGLLYGSLAAGLASDWRSADQQPEAAECLLRLATAAARHGLTGDLAEEGEVAAMRQEVEMASGQSCMSAWPAATATASASTATATAFGGVLDTAGAGVAGPVGAVAAAAMAASRAAIAAAALRLAAGSSGCDHRQLAAAALSCTCAVLQAVCIPLPSVVASPPPLLQQLLHQEHLPSYVPNSTSINWLSSSGGGGGGGGGHAVVQCQLLGVVVAQGHVVTAGLLAALLSTSPLPRLQKVVSALVLLSAAVARYFLLQQGQQQQQQQQQLHPQQCWQQQQQQPRQQQQQQDLAALAEACRRVLAGWLAAAAAHLQLSEADGAAMAASWTPVLAEAGVWAAVETPEPTGTQQEGDGSAAGAAAAAAAVVHAEGPLLAGGVVGRTHSRKLRRLLREFAERRMRVG
ncbi:hypothetical protein Agub_g13148, partial [Astrephomene gubernaculifera]